MALMEFAASAASFAVIALLGLLLTLPVIYRMGWR
jgi:hypothetical protein